MKNTKTNKKLISKGAEAEIFLVKNLKNKNTPKNTLISSKNNPQKNNIPNKISNLKYDSNDNSFIIDRFIIKDRIKKDYRIPEIDIPLRKSRTKREFKVLQKLSCIGIPVPKIISISDDETKLAIEYIDGLKLSDCLTENNCKDKCKQLGELIATMHKNGIIHGDLTTSNVICKKNEKNKEILYLIDFGLSFFSVKEEDKAVEIHLFRQALESRHNKFWKKAFNAFLDGYKKGLNNNSEYLSIINRLSQVEKRGRNKH